MNHKRVITAAMAVCAVFSCPVQTASAASYIVESFDNTKEIECLVYQPYDDAGRLVISMNEDMRTFVTVKQLSEEKEYFLFYDAEMNAGETTYTMPLEAGTYEITIGVPYAKNSTKIIEHTETITIENPDFNLDLQSTMYHYTLWRTENVLEAPLLLDDYSEDDAEGNISVYRAFEFQQVSSVKGDINADGIVDITDASVVLSVYARRAAGISVDEYTQEELALGDVDGNEFVDISDTSFILTYYARRAAGIETTWESVVS